MSVVSQNYPIVIGLSDIKPTQRISCADFTFTRMSRTAFDLDGGGRLMLRCKLPREGAHRDVPVLLIFDPFTGIYSIPRKQQQNEWKRNGMSKEFENMIQALKVKLEPMVRQDLAET